MLLRIASLICIFAYQACGKGCFFGTAKVTLANGSKAQLADLQIGDEVLSWDEFQKQQVASVVKAVPKFLRRPSDILNITLPHSQLYATKDHPLWSQGRGSLVSGSPDETLAEYGLRAEILSTHELLEKEDLAAVAVLDIKPYRFNEGLIDLVSPSEVMTLCLSPFHWFYVEGVRVHNKGCFVEDTAVSMADGSRKSIGDIRVGDAVLSWNEDKRQTEKSLVMHVPRYQRDAKEIVSIVLPRATVLTTDDHPFWSRGRDTLVSKAPNRTLEEYGLQAETILGNEQLEGESQEVVQVLDVRQASLPNRTHSDVDVMTLCLHPFHWFYVHGVRVHNKGCFAPWSRITMGDKTHKKISDVRINDQVLSWDETRREITSATIVGVHVFAASNLYQIHVNSTPAMVGLWSKEILDPQSLILTGDHPVYSSRQKAIVSMAPKDTYLSYGISALQMMEQEKMAHHLGYEIDVQVSPYYNETGNVPVVMTVSLDRHHWFYAEGVRVHNKGFGGGFHGGGFHGRGRARFRGRRGYPPRTWTRTQGLDVHMIAAMLIIGSRRRYGTWINSQIDNCQLSPNYTDNKTQNASSNASVPATGAQPAAASPAVTPNLASSGIPALDALCIQKLGNYSTCLTCNACGDLACMKAITGCQEFLAIVYYRCDQSTQGGGSSSPIMTFGVIGIIVCVVVGCSLSNAGAESPEMADMRQKREQARPNNERRIGRQDGGEMNFAGTYEENGEKKPTRYTLKITQTGTVTGSGMDDDGTAAVTKGIVSWPAAAAAGKICWLEMRPNANGTMEVSGVIEEDGSRLRIRASYVSSLGYRGTFEVFTIEAEASERTAFLQT